MDALRLFQLNDEDDEAKTESYLDQIELEEQAPCQTAWESVPSSARTFGGRRRKKAFGSAAFLRRANSIPLSLSPNPNDKSPPPSRRWPPDEKLISESPSSPLPSPPPGMPPRVSQRPLKLSRSLTIMPTTSDLSQISSDSSSSKLFGNDDEDNPYEYSNEPLPRMPRPAPIRQARSASMVSASTLRRNTLKQLNRSPGNSFSSFNMGDENTWRGENQQFTNDNNLDVNKRERKKLCSRRHSIQGYIQPLLERVPTVKSLQQVAPPQLDGDLSWLNSRADPSESEFSRRLDDDEETTGSTPERSVASRQRCLWDTPGADTIMSTRSLTSSSRKRSIFQLEEVEEVPYAPDIKMDLSARNVCFDHDDDEESLDNSPNTSMISTSSHMGSESLPDIEDGDKGPEAILKRMTSFDDLVFLAKVLREQKSRQEVVVGLKSWAIIPNAVWPQNRRLDFIKWARKEFGFAVQPIDETSAYLQIQKAQGQLVLDCLETAMELHKSQGADGKEKTKRRGSPSNNNLFSTSRPPRSDFFFSRSRSMSMSSHSLARSNSTESAFECQVTDSLIEEMQGLSMEAKGQKSKSLVRNVTLEPEDRFSLRKPRESLDSIVATNDLLGSMQGCDTERLGRPPRHSGASSTTSGSRPERLSIVPCEIQPTMEILGTPLNQDVGWGSRPILGRDWGCSEPVSKSILDRLLAVLEEGNSASDRQSLFCTRTSSNLALDLNSCDEMEEVDDTETDFSSEGDQDDTVEGNILSERENRRRRASLEKGARMSLYLTASDRSSHIPTASRPLWSRRISSVEPTNNLTLSEDPFFPGVDSIETQPDDLFSDHNALVPIFEFFNQRQLLTVASTVCTSWSDAATEAMIKLYCSGFEDNALATEHSCPKAVSQALLSNELEKTWSSLTQNFPWGRFLSYGAFKNVYKVHNVAIDQAEAISVMDVEMIMDKKTIQAELAVSVMLSSLCRRAVCPNFITLRGVFSCAHPPAQSHWGSMRNKTPLGSSYDKSKRCRKAQKSKQACPGRYIYIRMELCNEGDAEDFLKRQVHEAIPTETARSIVFQTAFALYAAADKFSVKHYDMKLLNIFLDCKQPERNLVLRYGLGSHTFAIQMPPDQAYIAKVADYGTANTRSDSNGQPVTIAQYTTLENTPPEFMILGDKAKQGHGHDCFGLGLCMLHLFTGHAPYEEILEEITCPPGLKKKLKMIWEDEGEKNYSIIRSVILTDVYKDEDGNITDGEPDDTLYHTLYRYLVLFGIPEDKFESKKCPKVWQAISDTLVPKSRGIRSKTDATQYKRDCKLFSLSKGSNRYIARARRGLQSMEGGMDLLFRLCSFNPASRASTSEVLNSPFMASLQEKDGCRYHQDDTVLSFTNFSTHR